MNFRKDKLKKKQMKNNITLSYKMWRESKEYKVYRNYINGLKELVNKKQKEDE